ncbi:MAG: DUF4245 domain-containing protein [Actinomycetota bacterium]|nr:DUF4245 domain-containing protein [Actinomycetota bacterium]
MSASSPGSEPTAAAQPRYERSTSGLVAAMIVVLGLVGLVFLVRVIQHDTTTTPIPAVDYAAMVRAGRADGKLATYAPRTLPAGWRPTSASYVTGTGPHWHLGMLTGNGRYVGLEESEDTTTALVAQYVDPNATRGQDVRVAGRVWQSWTDSGGDYALVRSVGHGSGSTGSSSSSVSERVLVVGSAPPSAIRSFVARLTDH